MRTALPAPRFLAEARAAARDRGPENCSLCSPRGPQVPYHFMAGRSGMATVETTTPWDKLVRQLGPVKALAVKAAVESGERVAIVGPPTIEQRLADVGRGIARELDQKIAEANGWSPVTLADRILAAGPPAPDPEVDRYIAMHAVDDIIGRRRSGVR